MCRTILILFLITFFGLSAQEIKHQDTLFANYLGQEQGLLQQNIKAMALDDLGYLWAGTEDGLHRFNSYEFNAYLHDPKDNTSIKDDHIRNLLFTKDTLWMATNTKGIQGFIPSQNTFFGLDLPLTNPDLNTAYKIFKMGQNNLLFSVKNHIIIFNRLTKQSKIIPLKVSQKESYVTDVLQINKSTYWLATSNLGVLKYDASTLALNPVSKVKSELNITFFKTKKGLFIGTKSGLFTYNVESESFNKLKFNKIIKCFYAKNDTEFYIGTRTGVFLFNIERNDITPLIFKIDENTSFKIIDINSIIGDDKGNLWVGTEADGLIHYNTYQKKFNTLKIALNEYPNKKKISSFQFLKDTDSTLWIGSTFGIIKYNFINKRFKLYNSKNPMLIYTITKDQNNTIWAGGFTSGLLRYNPSLDTFEKFIDVGNTLPDNDVVEIIPINTNTIWVCTWSGGIHELNIAKKEFNEVLIEGERLNRARSSLIDSKGNIWLGTDQGAYKISNNNKTIIYNSTSIDTKKLSSDRIFSIKEDALGHIWIGTSTGLTKLNPNTNNTVLYYKQNGLPNDFIYSVLIDKKNDVWVSTNYGISKLNTQTNSFKNYTHRDGLQNNEFNGKAGYKDQNGIFYFGGINGINIFDPEKISENPFVPKIYIESVELFNKPLLKNELFADVLEFKSRENVLTFNFSAINYLNPEKCNYTYKMEGFDTDWRPITKNRSTTYTNLDPGNYTFKVKASSDQGIWNETPKSLNIIIIPAWYNTLYFKLFVFLFLVALSVLFYRYKTKKLLKDKLKLENLVSLRTKELNDKNLDLQKIYTEADKQRNNIQFLMRELTHRVKNNLQIISSLLNIQASSLENNPDAKDALKVAKNRILTISNIENKIANNQESICIGFFIKDLTDSIIKALSDDQQLKFKVEYNLCSVSVKNLNTTMIGLILNELITNTTKYAFDEFNPQNRLNISCEMINNSFRIMISDNGKGYIAKDNLSKKSLGIELVSEMVGQLNGTIQIYSTNGVKNIIDIPL